MTGLGFFIVFRCGVRFKVSYVSRDFFGLKLSHQKREHLDLSVWPDVEQRRKRKG